MPTFVGASELARSFLLMCSLLDNSILGRCRLARYGQNGHDLDGFPGKGKNSGKSSYGLHVPFTPESGHVRCN